MAPQIFNNRSQGWHPWGIFLLSSLLFTLWFLLTPRSDHSQPLLEQLDPTCNCACSSSVDFKCSGCLQQSVFADRPEDSSHWQFQYGRDDKDEGLSMAQCSSAFPGLFTDLDRAKAFWKKQGGVGPRMLDSIALRDGMARGAIRNGELYVRAMRAGGEGMDGEDRRRKVLSMFSSMYRALMASPRRRDIQNIDFVFSVEDKVDDIDGAGQPLWMLTRRAGEESLWLMPDYGYWSWHHPGNSFGPYNQLVDKVVQNEHDDPTRWTAKEQKLIWRGKLRPAPNLRGALLKAAKDQPWSDTLPVHYSGDEDFVSWEDHCKYAFVAHVEGRSYDASLKYQQACRSVVVAHKLQWIQHHHFLMVSSGPQQNYVQVERDFSDLGEKMQQLIDDPTLAERIANNSVRTFRQRYLTPAAEACYWRQLWNAWGEIYRAPDWREPGPEYLRYESVVLMNSLDMTRI